MFAGSRLAPYPDTVAPGELSPKDRQQSCADGRFGCAKQTGRKARFALAREGGWTTILNRHLGAGFAVRLAGRVRPIPLKNSVPERKRSSA